MKAPVKLLYLAGDAVDRYAFLRMVANKNLPYDITSAETLAEARGRLAKTRFDVIVADYDLPDGASTELFDAVPDIPFVLFTGTMEEGLALLILERGADDYVPKSPDQRHLEALPFTIEKTLRRQHIREREQRLTRQLVESEARFRLLVQSVKDYAIYMLDRDGLVATWNAGAERIKGWKDSEILGRHYSVFFPPEDVAVGKPQRLLALAANQGTFHEQARRLRKDGSTFWAEITLTAVEDEHEGLIGYGKVTHDITEQRRAQNAVQESEASLQLALNAARFGMWKWDLVTEEMTWSDHCKALFGLSLDAPLTYTRFLQAVHPDDRQRVDEALSQALELRTVCNLALQAAWPDGSLHNLGMIGRGYYDETGKALRMTGVGFDATVMPRRQEAP
jgi:PAS domain S-box-containing protein